MRGANFEVLLLLGVEGGSEPFALRRAPRLAHSEILKDFNELSGITEMFVAKICMLLFNECLQSMRSVLDRPACLFFLDAAQRL